MYGPQLSRVDLSRWHLDIDSYLNPFLPAPPWHRLPRPVSHVLGHRREKPGLLGNLIVAVWSLIGVFCGVALVAAVSNHVPLFQTHHAPIVVGSFVSSPRG